MRLSKTAFAAFLTKNAKKRFRRNSTERCPLAKFLGKSCGRTDYGSVDGKAGKLPAWATKFVSAVDDELGATTTITGAAALKLLKAA